MCKEVLFDYTTDNAEEFAQQMEDIDDHNKLIIIRHKLEEAKATWNEVRTFGSEELKAKVKAMQPEQYQQPAESGQRPYQQPQSEGCFQP